MSHNNYNNIKKYAAFIFMVFTVLSGSSERIDSDSFARVGRKAFIDIFATSKLFVNDIRTSGSQLRIKSAVNENQGLRDFLEANIEASSLNYSQIDIVPLTISRYFSNNSIAKNNIWKSTVF